MKIRPSNTMKPILFNTEMVRATLDNRKTVTRRVLKPQEKILKTPSFGYTLFTPKGHISVRGEWTDRDGNKRYGENFIKLPYCPDDILYVRETFFEYRGHFYYKADGKHEGLARLGVYFKWQPSIHMPREAARIFLRVTDVHVERLQRICERGRRSAHNEGFINDISLTEGTGKSATKHFSEFWDSTIKPKDRALYGWDANPWVWVIEFERISREEAEHEQNKN